MMVHLYTDANGLSHFKDLAIAPQSTPQKAHEVTFTRVPGGTDRGTVIPPNRHYVFFMAGQTEIGVGDGVKKVFGPGDVLLIDDVGGKGHTTRVLPGAERRSMHVAIG